MNAKRENQLFLPDFCGIGALFGIIVMSELLAFMVYIVSQPAVLAHLDEFALISLLIQLIALSYAATLCIGRRFLARLREVPAAGIAYGSTLVICYLVSEAAWQVLEMFGAAGTLVVAQRAEFLFRNAAICAIASALALRYFYVQFHWRQQVQSESDARIQALQSRIRPHFLFNCMNTIASLTRTRPEAAERAVEALAALFRASLADARTLVPLAEELAPCRQYLEIEALRLDNRLRVEWAVDGVPGDAKVPGLTLQPLIENAIYHGIEPRADGGIIDIRGEVGDSSIAITVSNPLGSGDAHHEHGNRFAQDNVRQRLTAHFGARGTLVAAKDESTYQVVVSIPYRTP